MRGDILRLWELIQIFPGKWKQEEYGKEGGGLWVVTLCGRYIIWHNDIEEGFNISPYQRYGEFEEHWCNQALQANKLLHRTGTFWQPETHGHIIRSSKEMRRIIACVLDNSMKAGSVERWERWPHTHWPEPQ